MHLVIVAVVLVIVLVVSRAIERRYLSDPDRKQDLWRRYCAISLKVALAAFCLALLWVAYLRMFAHR